MLEPKAQPEPKMTPNGKWDIRDFASEIAQKNPEGWIGHNTAILIIHGIGNQVPLATLDGFARMLVETMFDLTGEDFVIEHRFDKIGDGSIWFNNYLRIKRKKEADDSEAFHLDLYEYYWANYAHDRASLGEIRLWIRDTVKYARKFYKDYGNDLREVSPTSAFLSSRGGLNWWKYSLMLFLIGQVVPSFMWLLGFLPKIAKTIPFAGTAISSALNALLKNASYSFTNVIGDIVLYNTSDAKAEHYNIRQEILKGALESLRRLIEPKEFNAHGDYSRVILAGHSLGTQISFDAINRLNHLITQNALHGINKDGTYKESNERFSNVADVLCGFVTFGSPLDKIAFFLREQSQKQEYLKIQMLRNYHCFKRRIMRIQPEPKFHLEQNSIPRLFDDIRWINYHDRRDYVSGRLDFYEKLVNVDCDFRSGFFSFTHGWYWKSKNMFTDIIENFLFAEGSLRHQQEQYYRSPQRKQELPLAEKKPEAPDKMWKPPGNAPAPAIGKKYLFRRLRKNATAS